MSDTWAGCYPSQWKGLIVPDAIAHPAKFSSKLIRRIYEHMRAEGWVKAGDTVIDPFGGVSLGALHAMRLGLRWVGVELEPRFVELGNANIALWNSHFSSMPGWSGDAVLLNGDSRELATILDKAGACVSSPPYAETEITGQSNFVSRKNPNGKLATNILQSEKGYSAAVSSPPYAETGLKNDLTQEEWEIKQARITASGSKYHRPRPTGNNAQPGYGSTPGQLGAMKANGFEAAVSSPPYTNAVVNGSGADAARKRISEGKYKGKRPDVWLSEGNKAGSAYGDGYGATPGQLGAMKANGFEAAVSSPPFECQSGGTNVTAKTGPLSDSRLLKRHAAGNAAAGYGDTDGNLGSEQGDDFWTAARTIVDQVYQVLAPGGHAVWVCKDFVKNKQIVPFCDQWWQMCEAAGFTTLHEHHALLVHSTAHDFDGKEKRRESKSFFRRLAENKGSPRIDFEVVLCMEKK